VRCGIGAGPLLGLLEKHPASLPLFIGLFEAEAGGKVQIAACTMTLAQALTGPLCSA
jgi:hypothetical protein